MNIKEKLMNIQKELKAPKGQTNSFGKYNYRSCEDILEAVKPLLAEYKCVLTISDELVNIGERYYIKATANLYDAESIEVMTNIAYARESLEKKGMDDSQITGATSSYARKYALNGLFAIDDTKDADTDEYHKQTNKAEKTKKDTNREKLITYCKEHKLDIKDISIIYELNKDNIEDKALSVIEDLKEHEKESEK